MPVADVLVKLHVFRRLTADDRSRLSNSATEKKYKKGDTLVREGESGNEFYVIEEGQVSVWVDLDSPKKVAVLQAGDYFGEQAILKDSRRNATIRAESNLVVLVISRQDFVKLDLHHKIDFTKRNAVITGAADNIKVQPPTPKTDADKSVLMKALSTNKALCTIAKGQTGLDEGQLRALIDKSWAENVAADSEIITQGDTSANYLYVVKGGGFDVFVGGNKVTQLAAGAVFGELALVYQAPRAATVKATTASSVWVFDRTTFKNILKAAGRTAQYVRYLDGVDTMHNLTAQQKALVADALSEMTFKKNETIITQGEVGEAFYILYEGEVDIIKDGQRVKHQVATESSGTVEYFGERALINNERRAATVTVTSNMAKCLKLNKECFNILLSGGIIQGGARPDRTHIMRKDLATVSLLGCGGFGYVELMTHKESHEMYALKNLSKGYIVKVGMKEGVLNEKKIFMMLDSPFVVKCYETYSTRDHLMFLLEPALGGELFDIYARLRLHGSVRHAKFYVAGVTLAFAHMHERRVMYRDLKPENLLITQGGQPKITDMGLAKAIIGKTYTSCGTPDYFAPEIISSAGHSFPVDWWTLGILLFELLGAQPPFEAEQPMEIFKNVKKGIGAVRFPSTCEGDARILITGLLQNEPSERLPMLKGGVQNIKDAPWYKGYDWAAMENLEMTPPYKPPPGSDDGGNFNASAEDKPPQMKYTPDGSDWDKDFATVAETKSGGGALAKLCVCCNA